MFAVFGAASIEPDGSAAIGLRAADRAKIADHAGRAGAHPHGNGASGALITSAAIGV
jgi:hypothetical protein